MALIQVIHPVHNFVWSCLLVCLTWFCLVRWKTYLDLIALSRPYTTLPESRLFVPSGGKWKRMNQYQNSKSDSQPYTILYLVARCCDSSVCARVHEVICRLSRNSTELSIGSVSWLLDNAFNSTECVMWHNAKDVRTVVLVKGNQHVWQMPCLKFTQAQPCVEVRLNNTNDSETRTEPRRNKARELSIYI